MQDPYEDTHKCVQKDTAGMDVLCAYLLLLSAIPYLSSLLTNTEYESIH